MDLQLYISVLWRRKLVIIAACCATVMLTVVATFQMPTIYTTTVVLRVATSTSEFVEYGSYLYSTRLLNTFAEMIRSGPVRDQMVQRYGIDKETIIDVDFPANTELMHIIVNGPDPIKISEVANALADILIDQSRVIRRANTVFVVEPSKPPLKPAKPNKRLNIAMGFIAGMVGGIGLAFIFESLDDTLYSSQQVEEITGLSLLGKIPPAPKRETKGFSLYRESFRRLATTLSGLHARTSLRTILITSAQPQEGKSSIVSNLAFSLARLGFKVTVLDCDLRMPVMHTLFGMDNDYGLSNVLNKEIPPEKAIQNSLLPGIRVITSGPLESYPAELLGSPQMLAIIEVLREQSDIVLLDTPSFLAVTDAAVLSPKVDGVVLVVNRAHSQAESVKTVCEQLVNLKARTIGVIVNRAEQDNNFNYYKYYYRAKKNE